MARKHQSQWDDPEARITDLENSLETAYRLIAKLKQENEGLRKQLSNSAAHFVQNSEKAVPPRRTPHRNHRSRRLPEIEPDEAESQFQKRKTIQFVAIVGTIVVTFALIALWLTRRPSTPSQHNQPSSQNPNSRLISPTETTSISPNSLPPTPSKPIVPTGSLPAKPVSPLNSQTDQFIYNVTSPQSLTKNADLERIITDILSLVQSQGLPTNSLSITLIDVNQNTFAEYQQHQLKFPASVVKLFWLVAFYQKVANGEIIESQYSNDLKKMIRESDNEAASRILDAITDTNSGKSLNNKDLQEWIAKRQAVNTFFQLAGYENINISQKTFPIPYLKYSEPEGRDLQMRGDPNQPIRNKISTDQAARLMYEIVTEQAVLPEWSQSMQNLLQHNLNPQAWQNIDPNQGHFNPILAFFGEGIYQEPNLIFLSKAGWTSQTRQEVAFISSGQTHYILAVFAEDSAYSKNEKIFPNISRLVFKQMTSR